MKRLSLIIAVLVSSIVCCLLVSCSKSNSNPFVGTWSCTNHFYGGGAPGGGVDTFVFKSDIPISGPVPEIGDGNQKPAITSITASLRLLHIPQQEVVLPSIWFCRLQITSS